MWCHIRATGFGRTLTRATSAAARGTGECRRVARSSASCGLLVGLGALSAAFSVGCSATAPNDTWAEENPGVSTNPLRDGGQDPTLTHEWACLNTPAPAAMPAQASYQLTGFIVDYQSHNPVNSPQMRACLANDFTCSTGVQDGVVIPMLPTVPLPGMRVTLPAGFEGFLRITAQNYFPYDYYIGGPITGDVFLTQPFPLVTASAFGDFAAGIGVDPVAAGALGTLGVAIYNCDQEPAEGVALAFSDPADDLKTAVGWAQGDGYPVRTEGYPVLTKLTDSSGTTGFVNLPPRNISIEAVIGTKHFGKRTFQIKPGRLTTGVMRATGYANGY